MKKKMTAILLMLVLCLSLSATAFAVQGDYIIDEKGILSEEDAEELNAIAATFSDALNCDLLYVYTLEEDLEGYAQTTMPGNRDNRILLIENDEYYNIFTSGDPSAYVTETKANNLLETYSNEALTYSESITAYLSAAATLVRQNTDGVESLPDVQLYTAAPADAPCRMVDMADVLTDAEEAALLSSLDAVSERQQLDVVVVTVNDIGDKTLMEYADDYFDYNGYGFGENHDGVLLLARIADDGTYSPGNCWITTTGYGITAFTDDDIQYIGQQITPALKEGNFADAFSQYAALADNLITQAKSYTPYEPGTPVKVPFNVLRSLLVAVIAGLVVAFVVTGIMKGKLKTVRSQSAASNYLKQGSMHLVDQKDMFLYSNVTRTAKPKEIDSGGDSSTHTSSSGTTHGGGGF